jgi:hypothetical protein
VLGLHWSTPPRKIEPTYDELRATYGPAGEARQADKEASERIWKRVEEAYAVLKDKGARQRHRREAYPLKWSQQVDLMLDRADIAIYRKDFEEAYDLLMVCQDVEATPKGAELLKKLKDRQDRIDSAQKQRADFQTKK